MPNLVFKIATFFKLLGANGVGPASNDANYDEVKGWLENAFATIATFVGQLFETVYGWLVNLIWVVARLLLNLVDCLYILVQKLVGIDIYQNANWSELVTLEETDLIVKMLISDTVLEIFGKIALFSLILLFIFVIFSLIKSNYAAATSDSEVKVADVFKKVGKSLFLFLIIPFILVVGILGSNVILSSALNTLKGNNDLSFGGMIFSASAYDANKYRIYAKEGVRVPITYEGTGELVNPKDYQTESDMRGLFYKIVNGDVKLDYVTKDKAYLLKEEAGEFSWVNEMDFNNAYISDANTHPEFDESFNWFWDKYCDSKVLNDLKQNHDMIQGIYKTNWADEQNVTKKTFDWAETYKAVVNNLTFPTGASVSIYENSDVYQAYETFATLQLEYFVMADFIDYAVEHYSEFFIVNSDNENVVWSDIVVDKELINIDEYSEEYAVFRTSNGSYTIANGQAEIARENGNGSKLLSQNSFYVSYYNGENRLYWTEDGLNGNYAKSENSGATYIVCTKNEAGQYIPVTQTTTSFKSNFLNSNYGGPIVARGLFSSERFTFSGFDYERPTFINEITVGIDGNAVVDNTTKPKNYLFTDSTTRGGFSASAISVYKGTIGNLFTKISGSLANSWTGTSFAQLDNKAFENLYKSSSIKTKEGDFGLSNLYFNDEIAYYVETVEGENKYITFYDRDKSRMALSKSELELITIPYEKEPVTFSYVWDYKHGYEVVSDIDDISNKIDELSNAINEFKNGINGAKTDMIFDVDNSLIINYTADLIKIQHGQEDKYLLVGAKPVSIQMGVDGTPTEKFGSYKTVLAQPGNYSRDSIEGDMYNTGSIYKTESGVIEYKNLYIKGGKIYEGNGKIFWEPSKTNNLIETLPQTLSSIMNGKSLSYLYDLLKNTEFSAGPLQTFVDVMTNVEYVEWEETGEFEEIDGVQTPIKEPVTHKRPATFSEFVENIRDYPDPENIIYNLLTYNYAKLTENDILLGLASKVQRLSDPAYYSLNSRVIAVDEDNNGVVDLDDDGEPKYQKLNDLITLNEHSQILGTINDVKSEKISEKFEIPIFVYDRVDKNNYIVFASVGAPAEGYANSVNYRQSQWTLRCTANYTQYTGNDGTKNLGLIVSMDGLIPPEGEGPKNALKIRNGGVYYKKTGSIAAVELLISTDSLRQYVANSAEEGKLVEAALLVNKDIYNNEYIYFIRDELRGTLASDFNLGNLLNASPFRAKFMFAKFVQEEVSYRLQGGRFVLDYNFAEDVGIRAVCLYDLGKLNPLILIFATGIVFSMLWNCVFGLIERILKIVILFIMMPITLSTSTFDDNQRFGKWKDQLIENIFLAYTVLIMLNLYFALVPTLRTLTEGLVSWDDIPKAVQNIFASISIGGSNIFNGIKSIGVNITSAISNGATAVGNFISSISTNNLMLDNLTVSTEDASFSTVLSASFLNEILYVLFFLVFTSLVRGAKDTIGDFIFPTDLAENGEKAWKSAKSNIEEYKKSVPGQIVNKSFDLGNKAVRVVGAGAMGIGHKISEGRVRRRINRASEGTSNFTTNVDEIAEGGNDITFTPLNSTNQSNVNTSAIVNAMTTAAQSANATYITNINEEPRRTPNYIGRGSGLPHDEEDEKKKVVIKEVHSGGGDSGEIVIIREVSSGYGGDMGGESSDVEYSPLEKIENSIEEENSELSKIRKKAEKGYKEYVSARDDLSKKEDDYAKYMNTVYNPQSEKLHKEGKENTEEFENLKAEQSKKLEELNKAKTTFTQKQESYNQISESYAEQVKKLNSVSVEASKDNNFIIDAHDSESITISDELKEKIVTSSIKDLNNMLKKNTRSLNNETKAQERLIEEEDKAVLTETSAKTKLEEATLKVEELKKKGLKSGNGEYDEATRTLQLRNDEYATAVADRVVKSAKVVQSVAKTDGLTVLDSTIQAEIDKREKEIMKKYTALSIDELRNKVVELKSKSSLTAEEKSELQHLQQAEKQKETEIIEGYKALTVLELENKIKELENKGNLTTADNEDLANIKKALDQKTEGGFRPGDGTQTSIEGVRANSRLVPLTRVKEEHVAQTGESGSGKSADKVVVDEAEERLNTRIDRVIDATKESITGSTRNMNRRVNKVDANANARINETIEKTNVELRVRDADIVRTREKAEEAQSQIELIGQNSNTNVDALANAVKDYSERVNEELKSKAYVSDVNATNKQLASEMERGIKEVSKQNAIIDEELKLKELKDANKQKRKDFIKGPEKKKDDK